MELSKTSRASKKIQHFLKLSITFKDEEFMKIHQTVEMILHKELDKGKFMC